jgi:hypothetical protein
MRRIRALLATIFVSGLVLLPSGRAWATCDTNTTEEEALFPLHQGSNGVNITVYGNGGTIHVRDRNLNPCGTGTPVDFDAEAHSRDRH